LAPKVGAGDNLMSAGDAGLVSTGDAALISIGDVALIFKGDMGLTAAKDEVKSCETY
jgi:hypothetical protein